MSFFKQVAEKSFYLSACQTFMILLYGGRYLYEKHAYQNLLYIICFFIIVVAGSFILYGLFKRKEAQDRLLPAFLSASFIVSCLLVGGGYIHNEFVISKENPYLSFSLPLGVGILFLTCLLIYFFFNSVIPAAQKHLFPPPTSFRKKVFFLGGGALMGIVLIVVFFKYWDTTQVRLSPTNSEKPNVILITMDTTRRDHLSCYGYTKKTTPHLDQLAEDGVVFENVRSTSSWTLPAHASLFTGLYPFKHGAYTKEGIWGYKVLGDDVTTLAEILAREGYINAGFIGGYFCSSFFGMAQGFHYYYENLFNLIHEFENFFVTRIFRSLFSLSDFFERHGLAGKKIAPQINRAALKWVKHNDHTPFFLFLNYFDPHHPYIPRDTKPSGSLSESPVEKGGYVRWETRLINQVLKGEKPLGSEEKQYLIDRYDDEITQMDQGIGELIRLIKEMGIYDDSLILITSDHGESFGEHGLMTHPPAVYEELIAIPLIVKYPKGHRKGERVFLPISLVDVVPEILSVLGIPLPEEIQGVPFSQDKQHIMVERYKDKSWSKRGVHFGSRSLRALYEGDYKFIWSSDGNHHLYNLKDDPYELNNLVEQMPQLVFEMEEKLDTWGSFKQALPEDHSGKTPLRMQKGVEEALEALGYLQ
jgi:arylsulfatase A-like enzyme